MNNKARRPLILAFSFLLPAGLMTLVFALGGICPFGGRSLGVLDMSTQYSSFLYAVRDVLTGKASAMYLPSMVLGGNMMGVIAYYMVSPLNLLLGLFPREQLLAGVSTVYILRVGLCGLTMAVYCGQRRGYGWRILIPAAAYGMTGYMCAYAIDYLWQDGVVLLPLIALGIARVAEGRGRWTYVLSLAAALAINFYIGYILCLFSVLFFLAELLAGTRPARGKVLGRMADFALSSLAAGALAAVILVPAAMALMGGKAGLSLEAFTLTAKFDFPQLFAKLFPGAFDYNELTPVGLPNIFCGTVTVGLAGLYMLDRAVPLRRRLVMAGLTCLLAASFYISAADLIWHGMNVPTWYNYRYSFLFSFLLIAGADGALASLREGIRPWHLLVPPVLTGLCAALAFLGRTYTFIDASVVPGAVAASAAGSAALYMLLGPAAEKKRLAGLMAALLVTVHGAELGLNASRTMAELTATSSDPAQWAAYMSDKAAALAYADTGDELIRVESPDSFAMNRCEPMLFGYDGLTHYGSTVSQKNLEFLGRMGLSRYKDLFVLYNPGITAAADSLLGIGYVVASDMHKPYESLGGAGDYTTWRDPYALPVGWTADAAVAGPAEGEDCFAFTEELFADAAPEVGRAIFTAADIAAVETEGLTDTGGGHYALDGGLTGSVTYTVDVAADGPLYGQLLLEDYPGMMLFLNGAYHTYYGNGQMNGSVYLGEFSAGDRVTVRAQVSSSMVLTGAAFATEDISAVAAYHDAMAPGGCALQKLSGSHFAGSFTAGEGDSYLVLTLPQDDAWRVTLDGAPVETVQVRDCLTAIAVTPGSHTLDMRYLSPGLIPGGCVSALAAACIGAAVWEKKAKKRRTA